jgi:hypothetical protein
MTISHHGNLKIQKSLMNNIKTLLFCGIFFMTFIANAQSCDNPQSPEPVRIYFVNGMYNSYLNGDIHSKGSKYKNMIDSREALKDLVGSSVATYGNSFNFQENHYTQLKQVVQQRAAQPVEFWQWMAFLSKGDDPRFPVPLYLRDADVTARINKAKELNAQQYFIDKDLQVMVGQYLLDLKSGKKVVLVAHSQGNFYANNAYLYIKSNYPQYANSIGIVMTASPASINTSGGPHTNNKEDLILNTVKKAYPILGQNVTWDRPGDSEDHGFDDVYLARWGDTLIKPQILSMINTLQKPTKHIDCATDAEIPVQIATWTATNVTATSATFNGYLTSGRNTFVWFNSQIGSSNVASCASNQSVYPGGAYQVGQHSFNKIDLPSNTDIYYRACAIGVGNRISEGMVVSFKTLPSPVATTRYIQVCTSRSLSLADSPMLQQATGYQSIGGAVNGLAFGSYGINPTDSSFNCRTAKVKVNFTNSFVFYLTNSNDSDVYRPYSFGFYEVNGQYINRANCIARWTLQNRTSATCYVVF